MGVEALHPWRVPPDAATRPRRDRGVRSRPLGAARRRRAPGAVRPASTSSSNRCTPPVTLQAAHRVVEFRIDQPVEGGHRRAVAQVRFVLDHDGRAVLATHDDGEAARRRSPEQGLDDRLIVEATRRERSTPELDGTGEPREVPFDREWRRRRRRRSGSVARPEAGDTSGCSPGSAEFGVTLTRQSRPAGPVSGSGRDSTS